MYADDDADDRRTADANTTDEIRAKVRENRETLRGLADSDLPAAVWARRALDALDADREVVE